MALFREMIDDHVEGFAAAHPTLEFSSEERTDFFQRVHSVRVVLAGQC
jgi:hypothetical protein